jgi:gliding motility associated protien GldN
MNATTQIVGLIAAALFSISSFAQDNIRTQSANETIAANCPKPRDNFYNRYLHTEKRPLPYDYVHEKDVFWEKRIWRLINIKEKRNHIFRNPQAPFIDILLEAAKNEEIHLYSAWDDKFSDLLDQEAIHQMCHSSDTIEIVDPITFESSYQVVENEFNAEDVVKFRLKEVWFFDEETSTMNVRILGIAPIISRFSDDGMFLNEGPMFWAYYPELRKVLARKEAFNPHNDAARLSWDDIFEARIFSSYITKQSNVQDRRIQDYTSGINALLEAEKIKETIFNFEHDLWSY